MQVLPHLRNPLRRGLHTVLTPSSTAPSSFAPIHSTTRRGVSGVVFQRYAHHPHEETSETMLNYDQFKKLVEETGVESFSEEGVQQLFHSIDKDGNGVIDRAEFLQWWPQVHQSYIDSTSPLAAYDVLLAAEEVTNDTHQFDAVLKLQNVHDDLLEFDQNRGSTTTGGFFGVFSTAVPEKTATAVKGLYIFGGVGCGKSFMMDLFFDKVPIKKKRRVHFNQFMLDVHLRMHEVKKKTKALDAIAETARQISDEVELLCFDEFQITDIGDAMIVKGLFTELYKNGLCMVATSNRAPDALYEGGLNRHKFLPFIDVVKGHCAVHQMGSETDYRREGEMIPDSVYLTPCNAETSKKLETALAALTESAPLKPDSVRVFGRDVVVRGAANNVAVFTFDDLCKNPLSEADYGAIARKYYAIVVHGVPAMTLSDRTEARRFIYFIDELYEMKCKLLCTAEVLPDALFSTKGIEGLVGVDLERENADALGIGHNVANQSLFTGSDEVFAFGRAVSRLNEMQQREYLLLPHAHHGTPDALRNWVSTFDSSV